MGKINIILKCVFVFFNVLFAILGLVLIILTMKDSIEGIQTRQINPNQTWNWLFAFGMWLISCLGAYGAYYEKSHALKTFAGCLGAGMIVTLVLGSIVAVTKSQVIEHFRNPSNTEEVEQLRVVYMALCFGLAATALLGLLMSIFMILQIKSHNIA